VDLWIWLLYGAGAYILVAASYRVLVSLKALNVQVTETTSKLSGFGPDEVEITKARPSTQDDLPKLLRDQRKRVRVKAQAKEQRRLRLISRISSINIDKRSA
jgi:hypothetical protein